MDRLPEIQKHLTKPRFNVQIYWLIEQAHKDGCKTGYLAEGLDEHFSGYWYKSHLNYIESWKDHFKYIRPVHTKLHKIFGLRCEIPFTYIDFSKTLPYWDPAREKTYLRRMYRNILPDYVINKRKRSGAPNWQMLWDREISKKYPGINPTSSEEIRRYLNLYTTWIWSRVHSGGG